VSLSPNARSFQVTEATVNVHTQFAGLRYVMYHWFYTTATVAIAYLFMAQVMVVAVGVLIVYFKLTGDHVADEVTRPATAAGRSLPVFGEGQNGDGSGYRPIGSSLIPHVVDVQRQPVWPLVDTCCSSLLDAQSNARVC